MSHREKTYEASMFSNEIIFLRFVKKHSSLHTTYSEVVFYYLVSLFWPKVLLYI
jgi:hypothetical protein